MWTPPLRAYRVAGVVTGDTLLTGGTCHQGWPAPGRRPRRCTVGLSRASGPGRRPVGRRQPGCRSPRTRDRGAGLRMDADDGAGEGDRLPPTAPPAGHRRRATPPDADAGAGAARPAGMTPRPAGAGTVAR